MCKKDPPPGSESGSGIDVFRMALLTRMGMASTSFWSDDND